MISFYSKYIIEERINEYTDHQEFIFLKLKNRLKLRIEVNKIHNKYYYGLWNVTNNGYYGSYITGNISRMKLLNWLKVLSERRTHFNQWDFNPNKLLCSQCGDVGSFFIDDDGNLYCESCFEDVHECDDCGELYHTDELIYIEGIEREVCEGCYEEYRPCDHCGEIYHTDDLNYCEDCDIEFCESCYDEHVLQHEEGCESTDNISGLYGYNYVPSRFNFIGEDIRYYGVELEVEYKGDSHINVNQLNIPENFYCKYDGSLQNGFEVVSHPMNLKYHLNEWGDILNELKRYDCVSHNPGTCGLHIHVNKNSLGITEDVIENNIDKILLFIEDKLIDGLFEFSRRKLNHLNRWCKPLGYDKNKDTIDVLKDKKKDNDRYHLLNVTNTNTIEFRLIRGTLKESSFIAAIKLFDYIVTYCINHGESEIEDLNFKTFIKKHTDNDVIEYSESRNII